MTTPRMELYSSIYQEAQSLFNEKNNIEVSHKEINLIVNNLISNNKYSRNELLELYNYIAMTIIHLDENKNINDVVQSCINGC